MLRHAAKQLHVKSMILGLLRKNFEIAGASSPVMETEGDVIRHAFVVYESMKQWLIDNNYRHPLTALELMMRKKYYDPQAANAGTPIRMRRDGETPDFLHELRIGLAIIADYYEGTIPKHSLPGLLCLAFTHDLGEDFNYLPDAVAKYYDRGHRSNKSLFSGVSSYPEPDIEYLTLGMETLTFDRKYTETDIKKLIGISPRSNVEITPEMLDKVLDKIESDSVSINGYLPKMKYLSEPDSKGRYIFSRFISEDNRILDWNLYQKAWRSDPNTGLVKCKDRADGLGTRIGPNFDIMKYGLYLSTTYQIFSIDNVGRKMSKQYNELADSFESTDKMLGALHLIGRIYVGVHPLRNPAGTKGFTIPSLNGDFNFRDFFPGGHKGYRRMPDGMNPLPIILSRINKDPSLNGDGPLLCEKLLKSIQQTTLRNSPNTYFHVDQLSLDFSR